MTDGEIKIKKVTLWQLISGILFVLLLVSIFTNGFGLGDGGATGAAAAEPAKEPAKPTEPAKAPAKPKLDVGNLDLANTHFKGDKDAPVTIVVYDDFQCPFCAKFETGAWPKLKEEYIDTGKVKFYYKHFPLGFHQLAQPASEASECAGDQDKFWEMHDKIFENQASLTRDNLDVWADDLDLDVDEFKKCMEDGKYAAKVKADFEEGKSAGITGTPSFIVQDELLVGAQPFEKFKQVIDAKLG
jgi:protein-disulfide isomerase